MRAYVLQHLWVQAGIEILLLVAAAWVLRHLVISRLRRITGRTANLVDDQLVDLADRAIRPILTLTVAVIALNIIHLPSRAAVIVNRVTFLLLLVTALYYGSKAVRLLVDSWLAHTPGRESLREPARFVSKVVFVALGMMVVLDNMGVSLTAVWTTLGVGSVAVALALQDTLSNFFAGVYLRLDNPIRLDDYVKLESGEEGFVVQQGWRSTRIRTLPNNIVIVPNAKLASTIVTNYSLPETQMSLLVPISVSYESNPDQVEQVLVEEAARAALQVDGLLGDPAPFVRFIPGFGESSLDFTLICRVNTFVDQYLAQHELRKRILARFRREGISIPFPQRDVHLIPGDGAPGDPVDSRASVSRN
ncbi:MAG TPA: mechanosensitive ion channel family protein [Terriglobales bacterium]|jgi:small-conductance mechanosensitive channel